MMFAATGLGSRDMSLNFNPPPTSRWTWLSFCKTKEHYLPLQTMARPSIPGLGRFPGGGHGNPLQYRYLENPHGQRSLAGYSPWGRREVGHDWETKHSTGQIQQQSSKLLLLLRRRFSPVQLCATPQTAAHQAPPPLGFSRQEHWSGLPFPSPMHESEKGKRSRSVLGTPWTAAHQAPY